MEIRLLGLQTWFILAITVCFIGCSSKLVQKQPNIPNGGRAVAIAPCPVDDEKIVVASETGGLFRTVNSGTHWTHVSGSTTFRYRDVMFLPKDAKIVIAAANVDTRARSGGGIYRSTDGGFTWKKAIMNAPSVNCRNSMAAHCLSFDASNDRLWTGTDCGLFYSDDQGANWTFLSGATGLGNSSIRAVLTPAANKMVVLTDNGVRISTNGGSNWIFVTKGLPGNREAGEHNQIAISPINNQHIYFAFNFSEYDTANNKWEKKNALYYTQDFGGNWSEIVNQDGWARPPFVILSQGVKIDLYYSDGGSQLRRREVIHGTVLTFGPWNNIKTDHGDAADIGFSKHGKAPILLASDGGIHKTTDNGRSWKMAGGGPGGYNALQITEVTGQKTDQDGLADLYFATQDNDIWASTDYGATWPNKRKSEGFYLTVPRKSLPASSTTHTGVSCWRCGNYKSGPALTSQSRWKDPPRNDGNPAPLIKPSLYVQKQYNSDSTAWMLARSENTDRNWTSVATITENAKNLPLVVGSGSNPIIYLATEKTGTTNGAPNIGLKRVSGFLTSIIIESELTGFGNIGTFVTEFAWYEVFAVNPSNPNYILVPDIANDVVKKSTDGGITWNPDNNLTNLVTNSGEFKFHWDRFSQISCFGFDPECSGHIMVGTQQAGIFQTFNNGNTWEKVPGSEKIPFVSSFFFPKKGEVVISSYGRGLWRFRYRCPPPPIVLPPQYRYNFDRPALWFKELLTPITNIVLTDSCARCGFFLLKGGNIVDIEVDTLSGKVNEIFIDKGSFKGYSLDGEEMQIPVRITQGKGGNGIITTDKKLAALLEGKATVRGIYLNGNLYNGAVLSNAEINQQELPRRKPPGPAVRLEVNQDLGMPVDRAKSIVITGRGFDPKFPIEVIIDNEPTKLDKTPRFDDKGLFRLSIPPTFGHGNHTVLIRQKTDKDLIESMVDIRMTVHDSSEERQ